MHTDISDLTQENAIRLQANESYSDVKRTTSLAIALATVAAFAYPHNVETRLPNRIDETAPSFSTVSIELNTTDSALLGAINAIMEALLTTQQDLDQNAKAILFKNRKDLYY